MSTHHESERRAPKKFFLCRKLSPLDDLRIEQIDTRHSKYANAFESCDDELLKAWQHSRNRLLLRKNSLSVQPLALECQLQLRGPRELRTRVCTSNRREQSFKSADTQIRWTGLFDSSAVRTSDKLLIWGVHKTAKRRRKRTKTSLIGLAACEGQLRPTLT